jgi:anti-sigma regulatory factor (Ser/Thr protein kinase)
MRRALRPCLDGAGLLDEELEDVILAAGEAASDAAEHAQQPADPFFDVAAAIDDGVVTISVRDHGHWREPPPGPQGRWGLTMMRALGNTSADGEPHGTTVGVRARSSEGGEA